MVKRYSIVELLTFVKPFYFKWFYKHVNNAENIIYLEPDIKVYGNFNSILE